MGLFKKLFGGLAKTASNITQSIAQIFTGTELDDDFYDDLTAILLSADMGMDATEQIIADVKTTAKKQGIRTQEKLKETLSRSIAGILDTCRGGAGGVTPHAHSVILIVGVNGVGKTTAIGRLAAYFKSQHKSVLLAAADTFRAAATEQLDTWATRAGVRIVKQDQGADPASIVFDAIASAKAKHDDIVLVDTAGRLHNKTHLVEELKKIDRVVQKGIAGTDYAYEKYIVLDATTGQNALNQVEVFGEALGGLDGVVLTKLDGTAKGGVVVAIAQQYALPVKFVGVGEKLDDLLPFDATEFANAIVGIQ